MTLLHIPVLISTMHSKSSSLTCRSFGKEFNIDGAPGHKSKSLFETVYSSASTPIVGLGEELKYNFFYDSLNYK